MSKEELRQICIGYFRSEDIKASVEVLDMYSNFFLDVVRIHQTEKVNSQRDVEGKIVLQMMWSKVLHLKSLLSGVGYKKDQVSLNNIIDPTIIANLTRNIYETAGMFNVVYRTPFNDEARLILYNLWVHSGLSYRQRFIEVIKTKENLEKAADEKMRMDELITEIKNTQLFNGLDEKNRGKIDNRLEHREYLIRFDNNEVVFLNWNDVPKNLGIEKLFDKIYGYFSMYAHPSNVSVFQFADMFKLGEEEFLGLVNFNLHNLFVMVSSFIADYIAVYPNVLDTFNKQPLVNQIVINFHQKFVRGPAYTINNASDALN
jgi:hypothetical protein